jgi:aquaporin related protein
MKVTLALLLVGAIKPLRAGLLLIAQLVAGIAAAAVADGLTPGPLNVSNKLSDGVSNVRGLFIEVFLTAQLVLAVLVLAVEKHKATFLAPVGIGLALFVIHMAGVPYDGCSVNPARSLGPEVISGFQGYDWIFYVGPFLGALLAVGLYKLLKVLVYETANPGQDFDELETAMFIKQANASTREQVLRPSTSYRNNSYNPGSYRHSPNLTEKDSLEHHSPDATNVRGESRGTEIV